MQSFGIRINDLVQLDDFIEHATFHSEEYGDNVLVFISKHYGELKADHDKEHQEEKEDHDQLPFQQQTAVTFVADFILNTNKDDFQTTLFSEFKKHTFYYQAPSSSLHSQGILQPPRHS